MRESPAKCGRLGRSAVLGSADGSRQAMPQIFTNCITALIQFVHAQARYFMINRKKSFLLPKNSKIFKRRYTCLMHVCICPCTYIIYPRTKLHTYPFSICDTLYIFKMPQRGAGMGKKC
jgi:hypothetical protein